MEPLFLRFRVGSSYNGAYGSISGKLLKLKADGSEFTQIVEGTFLGVLQ